MAREDYSGVRGQIFEVIVRQALAGAPWREICAGPLQENNIAPEDVEAEVQRRRTSCGDRSTPKPNSFLLPIIIVVAVLIAIGFKMLQH